MNAKIAPQDPIATFRATKILSQGIQPASSKGKLIPSKLRAVRARKIKTDNFSTVAACHFS